MIRRLSITAAAFDTIADTLPLGNGDSLFAVSTAGTQSDGQS
jgi:hypothetical protein